MSGWTSRMRIAAIAFAGSLVLSAHAWAAITFTVDSVLDQIDDDISDGICHTAAGTCTLRAAVMSANKATGPGVTIMLPAGIYNLTRPATPADGDDAGDLNLTAPVSGSTTITLIGAGAGVTVIDGNQIDRVLRVDDPRQALLSGITLRNGFVSGDGGGMYVDGLLTLTNCTVSDNQASGGKGGGAYVGISAELQLAGGTFSRNKALSGGGIYTISNVDADNCTLDNNQATGGDGGGIQVNGASHVILQHCALHDNSASGAGGGVMNFNAATFSYVDIFANMAATLGGGIYSKGSLSVDHGTIRDNIATFDAGGIEIDGATAHISQTTISGNVAHGSGGGIYVYESATVVLNSTIALNTADGNGGGIYHDAGLNSDVGFYNSTIAGNGADQDQDFNGAGGGVFLNGTSGNGFNLYNTILAQNIVSNHQEYDDCTAAGGALKTHARNLFGSGNGCTIVQISGSYDALSANSLGSLQNNGGPTKTIALLAGSNAIDGAIAGVGCRDSLAAAVAADQRGYVRGTDSACDIGAYEYDDIFADGFELQ